MNRVALIAEREFADSIRSKRFFLALAVFFALFAINLAFLSMAASVTRLSLSDLFLHNIMNTVSFLAAILGIALGFSAISGERERGTLKLVLTRPVTRDQVLAGKTLGALAVMLLAVELGYLLLLGIGAAAYNMQLSLDAALRGALATLFIVVYGMIFYAASLLFSSLASKSSQSMVTAIAFWLILVFILPVAASVVAISMAGPPPAGSSDIEYWQKVQRITQSLLGFTPDYNLGNIVNALLGSPARVVSVSAGSGNQTVTLTPTGEGAKPIPEALAGSLPSIAILLAWLTTLYGTAYVAFALRKDEK